MLRRSELLLVVMLRQRATEKKRQSRDAASSTRICACHAAGCSSRSDFAGLEPHIAHLAFIAPKKNIPRRLPSPRWSTAGCLNAKRAEQLPVGRKTANVILNVAFEQPEIAVDTHISALPIAPHRARQERCSRWKKTAQVRSRRIQEAARAPLADPARRYSARRASRILTA
jgi:hypothetical protein